MQAYVDRGRKGELIFMPEADVVYYINQLMH
jgi:hypothetical protein